MPSVETLVTFALAGVVLVVVPGPSVLFIVGRALAHGRRAALTSVAGNTVGVLFPITAVALGIGAAVEQSAVVLTVLKIAGALYLVYLGVHTIRTRGDLVAALGPSAAVADRRTFGQGVVVGATNPKVIVFFGAVLPQFVDPTAGSAPVQMLVLGGVFALLAAVLDAAWGLGAGAARDWFATSPARLRAVGGTGGLLMIVMGAGLAVSGRRD